MFKNYLKIALRNLGRQKGYSFINIFGLGVGIAICLLLLLWIQFQFSYDKFHENIDELFWVGTLYQLGSQINPVHGSPPAIGPALKEDFPEIVRTSRYFRPSGLMVSYGDNHFRERLRGVDPDYFMMFSFSFIKGDPATAFSDPYSIVLTERMAEKYFQDEDPLGKILTVENQYDFKVTGVIERTPDNSTIGTEFYIPISFATVRANNENYLNTWYNCAFYTFAQLQKGADYREVNQKILKRIKQSHPESNLESFLFPFSRIHLHSISGRGGFISSVVIFSIIALAILGIAIINFVNLMTARSGKRIREVGLRKVVGARRSELIKQFYCESMLHALAACLLAGVLVELLLPTFRSLLGAQLSMNFFNNPLVIPGLLAIALLTGILAGTYPALRLSGFQPVKAFRGTTMIKTRRSPFRRGLVVFQFVVSISLIISTTVIYKQFSFLKQKELGFNKDQVIYLPMNEKMQRNFDTVKSELLAHPNVQYVTRSTHSPTGIYWNGEGWEWDGKDPTTDPMVTYVGVGADYIETFGMEMLEGEFYTVNRSDQQSDGLVINEAFANLLGMDSVIGQRLSKNDNTYRVQGVVKNFNFKPLYSRIGPLVMYYEPERPRWQAFLRINEGDVEETLAHLENIWINYGPDFPFEYHFLDEDYERLYRGEKGTGDLLRFFAVLAVLISCMGLFGLACFMAEQRTKEIGIRKVLGASVGGIVKLLSREFVVLVGQAILIATPIAYLLMAVWLQNYAYRTSIALWIFLLAGATALLVALLTVSLQAFRAAAADPVKSLRYE